MHPYDKSFPRTSAHFRYRRAPNVSTAPTLFDALPELDAGHAGTRAAPSPTLHALSITHPSFSAFLRAHHHAHDARTLDASDVGALVNVSDRILHLLADGAWHDVIEVRDAAGALSYDRRLRDLRKLSVDVAGTTYYLHIDARRVAGTARTWEYRAHIETFPQRTDALKEESGKSHNE